MTAAPRPSAASLVRLSRREFEVYVRPHLRAFLAEHAGDPEATADEGRMVNDLYDLVHGESGLDWAVAARGLRADLTTPCAIAVAGVAISSVALVVQAAGLPVNVSRAIGTGAVDAAIVASPSFVDLLEAEVAALKQAEGLGEQAAAVFTLFRLVADIVTVAGMVTACRDELPPYQWMLAGTVAAVQLTSWLETSGLAATAELMLLETAVTGIAISTRQAYQICHPGDGPAPEPFVSPAVNSG